MIITVYRDTIDGPLFDKNGEWRYKDKDGRELDNMADVEVSDEGAFQYFIDKRLADYKTDEDLSDKAFYEDWLHEYTCDDTDDFYEYATQHGIVKSIRYYGYLEGLKCIAIQ